MRIFVAGATGAVGRRLVPLLVAAGHHVTGTTRTPTKVSALRALGADPIVLDGLDRDASTHAVLTARPAVVVHQMTALASVRSLKRFDEAFAGTNRLRTEAARHLLDAARAAGARRVVAQSYTGWPYGRTGSRVKTEDDPLDPAPPPGMARTLDAIRTLEAMVTSAQGLDGIVLRYGTLYGPGTSIAAGGDILEMVRRRRLPIVGGGAGLWSFVHVDDAALATRLAIEGGPPGIYNIVDDEPAAAAEWLTRLAHILGAKPPLRIPSWIGRLAVGEPGVFMMTEARGASNAKARRVLDWRPAHPSWRDGFKRL